MVLAFFTLTGLEARNTDIEPFNEAREAADNISLFSIYLIHFKSSSLSVHIILPYARYRAVLATNIPHPDGLVQEFLQRLAFPKVSIDLKRWMAT
jgi:hypothetical protein